MSAYLDNAATTLRKPSCVHRAAADALRSMTSPARGHYAPARRAEETAFRCRERAAALFGAGSPERVVFTMNATHALNLAIRSLVPPGGHAVISGYEHNAVTRPLHALDAQVDVAASPLFDRAACVRAFASLIRPGLDAVVCTHASNVFGFVLPIEDIAALCRAAGVPLVVDASQSAGLLPLDMSTLGAAFVAMPGHKGLYGPQGTGLLLCAHETSPLLHGGTGSDSLLQQMPAYLPDRLEPGTHNMPGIAGLEAGLRFVQELGTARILAHERALLRYAVHTLARIPQVTCFTSEDEAACSGVLSFTLAGRSPEEAAEQLSERGVALRAGLHCAPLAHRTAGTLPSGTLRASFSAFSTRADVDALCSALRGFPAEG